MKLLIRQEFFIFFYGKKMKSITKTDSRKVIKQIREQFNEDHEEAKRQRRYDRILGMAFSMLETTLFIVGIIYATILFLIEMYYSVNINFI